MARPFLKGSLKVARIFGIPVYLHFSFLILIATLGFLAVRSGASDSSIVNATCIILILFCCIVAHEYGHALMARKFGIQTLDITLLPIGGVARLQRMPEKPSEELLVALAGPAVNVIIAAVLYVYLSMTGGVNTSVDLENGSLPQIVLKMNLSLLFFNLMPAFPMDGGRVLRALLAMKLPYAKATSIAARIGQGMAVLFALVVLFGSRTPFYHQPMLFLIAVFVWFGAKAEAAQVLAREALQGVSVERMMLTDVRGLPGSASLGDAVEVLSHSTQRAIPVSDDAGFLGVAGSTAILEMAQKHGVHASLELALQRDVLRLDAGVALNEALQRMQENGQSFAVVLKDGVFAGMLDAEHVTRALALQQSAPTSPPASARDGRGILREPEYIFPPLR